MKHWLNGIIGTIVPGAGLAVMSIQDIDPYVRFATGVFALVVAMTSAIIGTAHVIALAQGHLEKRRLRRGLKE